MKPISRILTLPAPVLIALLILTACGTGSRPTIESFTATPSSLPTGGGNTTLAWTVSNATSVSIEPKIGAVSGTSLTLNVSSNKTYTLTASKANGTVTANTSVTVAGSIDNTPSSLLSIGPSGGATGVAQDVTIVLSFSKAMKQAETQATYQSSSVGIRPNEVSFEWNSQATVLMIRPNAALAYASGTDPNTTAALSYSFSLSGASDLAGNTLAPIASEFRTLRRITAKLPGDPNQDGSVDGSTLSNGTSDMTITTSARGFLGFNLNGLSPSLQASSLRVATLRVNAQFPIIFSGEQIEVEHVLYGANLSASATTSVALRNLGNLTQETPIEAGWKRNDVLAALKDDLSNRSSRANRSQYRLRCTGCTVLFYTAEAASSGGDAQFKTPELLLEYLLP